MGFALDLNKPVRCTDSDSSNPEVGTIEAVGTVGTGENENVVGAVRKRRRVQSSFEEAEVNEMSVGCKVKEAREVLRARFNSTRRRPNVNCRIERFGRICRSFDDRKKGWVREMGFGGLLNLTGRKLPRSLCYWLMTCIDSSSEMLIVGNKQFRLSPNQVRWVLGLPKGEQTVPQVCDTEKQRRILVEIDAKFGQTWTSFDKRSGKAVSRRGLAVTPYVVDKLEGSWEEGERDEFKTLFLLCALDMVLCPTQSRHLSPELMPSLMCATEARKYNWCALVLQKLMSSVRRFGRAFHKYGFAGGCGGCTFFIAVFYLDRLVRNPVMWGVRPRIKVWTAKEIRKACREDKTDRPNGDFGCLGVVDVAYGEMHPREARDTNFFSDSD